MAEKTDNRLAMPEEAGVSKTSESSSSSRNSATPSDKQLADKKKEIGGPKGPEPTRYGDWEKGGRCSDF